jgi:hypothetical protein
MPPQSRFIRGLFSRQSACPTKTGHKCPASPEPLLCFINKLTVFKERNTGHLCPACPAVRISGAGKDPHLIPCYGTRVRLSGRRIWIHSH